jgi:hypothetical protein
MAARTPKEAPPAVDAAWRLGAVETRVGSVAVTVGSLELQIKTLEHRVAELEDALDARSRRPARAPATVRHLRVVPPETPKAEEAGAGRSRVRVLPPPESPRQSPTWIDLAGWVDIRRLNGAQDGKRTR